MKILIVGAGKVGGMLAEHLSQEQHDVIILDNNEEALRRASETLDVMCMKGTGASPATLKEAGVASADLVLATTSMDEVNMLCSLTSKRLGANYTIARIRDVEYTSDLASLQRDLDIDMVINPEYSTAIEISQLLRFPPATNIETFFRGRVELLGMMVQKGDFIIGTSLRDLSQKIKSLPFLFCAAQRGEAVIIPDGSFVPQAGDKLYVVGEPMGIYEYFRRLGHYIPKVHSVFIVGGSRIAHYLTSMLEHMKIKVTIVENKEARCRSLSEEFPHALILQGDGTDRELLASEHFANNDAFIALTGRDEDNLLISLYARQQGLKKVVAKCNRENYISIVRSAGLDSVVSPKGITADRILRVVRGFQSKKGSVMTALYRIADNKAEAAEFVINETAHHLGVPLKNIRLKRGILVAAILHQGQVIIPSGETCIEQGDQVIVMSSGQGIQDFNDIYDA